MTNRKQPFGYKICNGKMNIYGAEADIVRQVFKAYLSGISYNTIMDMLISQPVSYDDGKVWTKHMIARILRDKRYIGTDTYPPIISAADYAIVQRQRSARAKACSKTDAQKVLGKLCSVRLSEQLELQVLTLLNLLTRRPELIRSQPKSQSSDDDSIFQRKLDAIMAVQPVNEEAAKKLIFENAAELYSQISTSDYESERLRRLFAKAEHSPALDSQLLKQSVAGVAVESQSLKLLLWNGQHIGKDDFQ